MLSWRPRKAGGSDAPAIGTEVLAIIRAADEARDSKDWQSAAKFYAEAVAKQPGLYHIMIQQGHALKEMGQYEEASKAYFEALYHMPENDDLHLQIGHIEKLKNNPTAALFYYKKAASLNPNNETARGEYTSLEYKVSQNLTTPRAAGAQTGQPRQSAGAPIIAAKVTGGVGDYLVIARYLRDLHAAAAPFEFEVFCNYQTHAEWVFSEVPGYRGCYSEFLFDTFLAEYPLALNINQHVVVHQETADWHLLKQYPRLVDAMHKIIRFRPQIDLFIQHHPYMDGFMGAKAVYMNHTRADFLHGMSGIPYGGHHFSVRTDAAALSKFGLTSGNYVTIHNGFDPGIIVAAKTSTKCYPHYDEVIRLARQRHPGLVVVQLGTSTSQPIDGVDLNLIGRTTLLESAAIIKNGRLHIDNEGGLVHLATAFGVPCCVVFGPTSVDYFGYDCNINIRPHFCGGCWWVTKTWMEQCPRGFAEARCMTEHDPAEIAAAILAAIKDNPATPRLGLVEDTAGPRARHA